MRIALSLVVFASSSLILSTGCSGKPGDIHHHGSGSGPGSSSGSGGASGSGGSGGTSGSGGAFNCDYKTAGFEYCYGYTGLTSSQTTAEQDACTAYPGSSTPSACPSANQSGCCEGLSAAGITYGYCVYDIPSADLGSLASACKTEGGTWSGGSGSGGGGSGTGGSAGSGSSGGAGGSSGFGGSSGSSGWGGSSGGSSGWSGGSSGSSGGSSGWSGGSSGSGSGGVPADCAQADDFIGCCAASNTVYYCNSSMTLENKTCTGGQVCGWDSIKSYYGCVAAPGGSDPSGTYPEACE